MTDLTPNNTQKLTLMTSIQVPRELDAAVLAIISETRSKTILALAKKFDFSVEEATSYIDGQEFKLERKRGPVPKKKKEKAKSSAEVKPKRSPTGYLMFSKSERESVQIELGAELAEGTKLAPQAVVKELAKRWKALGDMERAGWNAEALDATTPSVSPPPLLQATRQATFDPAPDLMITREETIGPDESDDGEFQPHAGGYCDSVAWGLPHEEAAMPLGVTRQASVSWNDCRLPSEAPACNHVGQCSCGW